MTKSKTTHDVSAYGNLVIHVPLKVYQFMEIFRDNDPNPQEIADEISKILFENLKQRIINIARHLRHDRLSEEFYDSLQYHIEINGEDFSSTHP